MELILHLGYGTLPSLIPGLSTRLVIFKPKASFCILVCEFELLACFFVWVFDFRCVYPRKIFVKFDSLCVLVLEILGISLGQSRFDNEQTRYRVMM